MHPKYALPFLAALALPLAARAGGDMIVTTPAGPPTLSFDDKGAQVGEQLPDLPVVSIDNEPLRLNDRARGPLTLIVTSSFTCPKSRANYPALATLAEKYKGKINVSILYVIEAHPAGDISPYRGKEDITPENTRDGILRRQPTTLDKRLTLANDFVARMGGANPRIPLMVDTMDNWAWKSVGAGPNMAILVDNNRTVVARQGWFNADTLTPLLDKALAESANTQATYSQAPDPLFKQLLETKELESEWAFPALTDDKQHDKLAALLIKYPKLSTTASPIMKAIENETLLQTAARLNRPAAVQLLLAKNADAAQCTPYCASPLHLAAEKGHDDLLKLLLANTTTVDARSHHGPTPLELALLNNHPTTAALLTAAGARETVFTQVARGNLNFVKAVLAADPSHALRPDGAGNSPFSYAAATGQTAIVQLLSPADAKLARLVDSADALTRALEYNHPDTFAALLAAGADPNTSSSSYYSGSILHRAADNKDPQFADLLLKAGAKPNVGNVYGRAPLHDAARAGNTAVIRLLLAAGATINAQSGNELLPCGPPGPTARLETPLHLAADSANPEAVATLLSAKADVALQDIHLQNVLHHALSHDEANLQIVQALIAARTPLNAEDENGKSPLDYAERLKNPALAKLLTDAGAKKGSGQKHAPPKAPPIDF